MANLKSSTGLKAFVVIEAHEAKGPWPGMETWSSLIDGYKGDVQRMLKHDPQIIPEDNATIIFTSGTSGLPSNDLFAFHWLHTLTTLPEGVLSTQRAFLSNLFNVSSVLY